VPPDKLVLGTRGSALALWQARHVAGLLERMRPGLAIEERIIRTEGDEQQGAFGAGDRGVFVRRIEQALLSREIDLAVHSMKDLPTEQPAELVIAATPPRHDPRDALISGPGWEFADLPRGTVVGTGSFRRRAQLLFARPDLKTVPLRGNVDTRMRRVADGKLPAVVLALAGLERLGLDAVPYRPIPPSVCLPAVGQGALAIETREADTPVVGLLAELDHPPTRTAVSAERAFLRRLGGGCLAPATAHATEEGESWVLRAAVGDPDGAEMMHDRESGSADEARSIGERLAERMLAAGAGKLLARARDDTEA
jgi:hydroxymethylbilane synthase